MSVAELKRIQLFFVCPWIMGHCCMEWNRQVHHFFGEARGKRIGGGAFGAGVATALPFRGLQVSSSWTIPYIEWSFIHAKRKGGQFAVFPVKNITIGYIISFSEHCNQMTGMTTELPGSCFLVTLLFGVWSNFKMGYSKYSTIVLVYLKNAWN